MSRLLEAIAAHRAAWQAFQDAPAQHNHPDTLNASEREYWALQRLLRSAPASYEDVLALKQHLDWWVVEEEQRREIEPEPFVLHAIIQFAAVPS